MAIENIELVNTLIFVMIGLVFINALFVLVAMFAVTRQVANARKAFAGIRQQTLDRLEDVRMILAKTYAVQKKIPEIEEVVLAQINELNNRTVQADRFLEARIARFTRGVDDVNRRMDIALHQYSRFTSQLDSLVRVPVINLKAFCSGVAAGVSEISHKEKSVSRIPNDEEFFI